jgi:hypothetical protein
VDEHALFEVVLEEGVGVDQNIAGASESNDFVMLLQNGAGSSKRRSKRCRRERNFWTQRPEAKNPPERPLLSAETGSSKIGVKNARRNGLLLIGDGFRSSGRLYGGGSSRAKPVSDGYQGKIQGKNEKSPQKFSGESPQSPVSMRVSVKNEHEN